MATPKQWAFARAVVSGMSASDAYRRAYNAGGMSAKSVANEAHRLMANPDIAPIIEEGLFFAMDEASWSRAVAIERMRKANDAAYSKIEAGEADREDWRAFFESADRLGKLACVDAEVRDEAIRRSGGTPLADIWKD